LRRSLINLAPVAEGFLRGRNSMFKSGSMARAVFCALLAGGTGPAFAGGYTFTTLALPGMPAGNSPYAAAINNSNQIVLESYDSSGTITYGLLQHAVAYLQRPADLPRSAPRGRRRQ
jgi:hypothetical protein